MTYLVDLGLGFGVKSFPCLLSFLFRSVVFTSFRLVHVMLLPRDYLTRADAAVVYFFLPSLAGMRFLVFSYYSFFLFNLFDFSIAISGIRSLTVGVWDLIQPIPHGVSIMTTRAIVECPP